MYHVTSESETGLFFQGMQNNSGTLNWCDTYDLKNKKTEKSQEEILLCTCRKYSLAIFSPTPVHPL